MRETGLEPVRVAPHAPQTCASADSATLASTIEIIANEKLNVNTFFKIFLLRLNIIDIYYLAVFNLKFNAEGGELDSAVFKKRFNLKIALKAPAYAEVFAD